MKGVWRRKGGEGGLTAPMNSMSSSLDARSKMSAEYGNFLS